MLKLLFLTLSSFVAVCALAAGNLHRQIDECDVTRDADCLKGILHQLARQGEQRASAPAKRSGGASYCVCENVAQIGSYPYLVRVQADGTKTKDKLGEGPYFPEDCTAFILKHPACRS